jgi:hypothetical protein
MTTKKALAVSTDDADLSPQAAAILGACQATE